MTESDFTFIRSLRKPERFNRVKNLTGRKFNRLLALGFLGITDSPKRRAIWLFQCDCGTVLPLVGEGVSGSNTKSCGCFKSEQTKRLFTTHGMRRSREYKRHSQMIDRCFNPNNIQADDYSGRGITVCEYLRDFSNFFKELGLLPDQSYSTDRIDNDGGYWCGHCPQCVENGWPHNIRWATRTEQGENRRTSRLLTVNGETHCLAKWCRRAEIDYFKVRDRLKRGWSPEEALGYAKR